MSEYGLEDNMASPIGKDVLPANCGQTRYNSSHLGPPQLVSHEAHIETAARSSRNLLPLVSQDALNVRSHRSWKKRLYAVFNDDCLLWTGIRNWSAVDAGVDDDGAMVKVTRGITQYVSSYYVYSLLGTRI